MSRVRRHLSFENVLVTVVAFAVLAGGTAFAANQLEKNSVGKVQLKANAVTTAKIKKNAVTAAKIKAGAIDGTKVQDGSLSSLDLNAADLPFGRVVHTAQSPGTVDLPAYPEPALMPLSAPNYTQEAGRDDSIFGAVDVTFDATCKAPRQAIVFVLLDAPAPAKPESEEDFVAVGVFQEEETGAGGGGTQRINLSPYGLAGEMHPAAAKNHTLTLAVAAGCKGAGATASNASLIVNGVK